MGLLDKLFGSNKNNNANKKLPIPRAVQTIWVYYSAYKLIGSPYKSAIINKENIEYLNPLKSNFPKNSNFVYSNFFRASMQKMSRESKYENADLKKCFEMMTHHFNRQDIETDPIINLSGTEAYHPTHISFFDQDSISTYHIVLVGDDCELRQTNYARLNPNQRGYISDIKQIDNHIPITDPKVIERLEYSFEFFLFRERMLNEEKLALQEKRKKVWKPLCNMFAIKTIPYHVKTPEEMMEYLTNKGHFAYIDWKSEYKDIVYNFNILLKRKGASEIPNDSDSELLGEQAAREIVQSIHCKDYHPVMIDAGTDGFYIALLDETTKNALQLLLSDMGFSYMPGN